MLRDVYWRQYPVDLLNDDKMSYIESLMPEGFEFAPYMFYITALKLADDNGIFDLEDGIIFSRLMRVKSRALVFQIANYMRQQKVIHRLSDDTTLMQLADWTYSDKKSRTIEERRKIVADAIAKAQAYKSNFSRIDFTLDGCAGKRNDVPQSEGLTGKCNDIPQAQKSEKSMQEVQAAPQKNDFLCPDFDKNGENVVKNRMDDKNGENVDNTQTIQTDNTIHTVQEVHTNKHTHIQQLPGYGHVECPAPGNCQNKTAVAEIQNQETEIQTENQTAGDANCSGENQNLAELALSLGSNGNEDNADKALFEYLNDFFVKNCYGFKPKQSAAAMRKLVEEIKSVSSELNPPLDVAALLCGEFKKMHDGKRAAYWKDIALLPSYMLKPRCWAELMAYAGKILATSNAHNSFLEAMEKAKAEFSQEENLVYDMQRQELLKYNIDPDGPNATFKLLQAKSQEQKAKKQAEEETQEQIDIF